jgi:CubicO group peptidase (beta-lactamase class C family)
MTFTPRSGRNCSSKALTILKDDWDRPPQNRWSFQHIREILPTTEVWRGNGPVRSLSQRDVDLDALDVGDGRSLSALLDHTYTDGFLVLHKGVIAYECYFNGMTARSLHLSQSVAKSVTGAVAGIMISRGELDVAAPVTDYLPELRQTGWKGASLQHVLDMTTGVRFSEEYTDPFSDIGQVDVASGWKPIPQDADPHLQWPTHMWELILGLRDVTRPHGAAFEYRSIETDVLAFCMEQVAGKRWAEIMSAELWQKMGAEESANFTVDPAGYAIADGGFNACLRDYGRFGQLILEGGGGIIPAQWIEATRSGNHAKFGPPYSDTLPQGAYHNQFWIEEPEHRSLMARGVFGQLIYISWQYNMVVVKLSTWPDFLNPAFDIATRRACHAIGQRLSTLPG